MLILCSKLVSVAADRPQGVSDEAEVMVTTSRAGSAKTKSCRATHCYDLSKNLSSMSSSTPRLSANITLFSLSADMTCRSSSAGSCVA